MVLPLVMMAAPEPDLREPDSPLVQWSPPTGRPTARSMAQRTPRLALEAAATLPSLQPQEPLVHTHASLPPPAFKLPAIVCTYFLLHSV